MRRGSKKHSLLLRARSIAHQLYEQGATVRVPEPTREPGPEATPPGSRVQAALEVLRAATTATPFEGNLWLVGGYVRNKLLGLQQDDDDIDLVMQADALEAAALLHSRGVTEIAPVVYPRFGTAMVRVAGCDVELVTARRESYAHTSRKPAAVTPATLEDDALRRDFTVNTLLENLHTLEKRDPTGHGSADLQARILRTPLPPEQTFMDDPLRMLRAVRFAAKLGFTIAPQTWDAICSQARRLSPPKVSYERMRDEFSKMLLATAPSQSLEMLRRSGLLQQFAQELCETVGVTQNEFHSLPVWDHTLLALDNLVADDPDAPLILRLAVLLHDIGKPRTRSIGDDGRIHFYEHQDVGAEMARLLLSRLKFSTSDTAAVVQLVAQHMRIGEYKPDRWTDAAVRRLVRESGDKLDRLFALHRADVSALSEDHKDLSRASALQSRIDELEASKPSHEIDSPLTGDEIMEALSLSPGPEIGHWKDWLLSEVLEGRLRADDKDGARRMLRDSFSAAKKSA